MNRRHFVFPMLLLFLLGACAHLSADHDKSPDPNNASASDLLSPAEDGKQETNAQLDPAGSASAGNGENKTENGLDADTTATQKIQTDLDEALELCQLSQDYWQQGELENAVEALDRAYALIISADTSDQPKLIQQKEDLRFMISKRILEIYASRHIVVNGNHNAIPIVVNRHVQAEINLFTKGGERRFFIESLKRSGRYRDRIVSALKEAGLPEELSWLPLIESGFKTHALSRSRALGLWQFIPSTGYKFGLHRDKFIDERMDPAKATRAAIDYLKELHSMFGDWSTVLAAYNCGEGRVLKVIRNQNINYLDNFWDLYERLPRETARYVPRFLATLHVLNNLETYGMDQIVVDQPLEFETVIVNKQVSLGNVARSMGVNEKVLKELNPELRYKILPGGSYSLRVPPGSGEILLSLIDRIPVSRPPQRAYVYHRVRHGETLSVIARKYRTSVGSIMRANNMRRSNYIVAGKRLKIPQRGYKQQTTKVIQKPKDGQAVSHVVRKSDSLYIIAKQYGTTTKKIQELNNLRTTTLYKGQRLTIFSGRPQTPPAVDGLATYEVRAGDSPFVIARRHNMPLDRLLYLNQLYPGTTIFPGQKLYIE
ncbi:Membrane-bound lytic murein transglycosylase D [Olavius sp. associated proteobacterium Delta 1]|nr:Membrane-bound lytic murein transglycosylase D [Olavius sp. associated proteobacterium Delta 1]